MAVSSGYECLIRGRDGDGLEGDDWAGVRNEKHEKREREIGLVMILTARLKGISDGRMSDGRNVESCEVSLWNAADPTTPPLGADDGYSWEVEDVSPLGRSGRGQLDRARAANE
jgi:hypothetical protein